MNQKELEEKRFQAACAALSGLIAKYGQTVEFDYYQAALFHADQLLKTMKGAG